VRVLVTGGLGYVGHAVVLRLAEAGHEVTVLTRRRQLPADLSRDTEVHIADLLDQDQLYKLFAERHFDGVCHLAGLVRVRESFDDPAGYFQVNVGGTANLLVALAGATEQTGQPARLVFASTAAVYGPASGEPISEDHQLAPTSPYGASKLAAEQLIGYQAAAGALGAVTLRGFSIAGAIGSHGDTDHSRIIPKALAVAAGIAPQVEINGDGSAVREFTHVAAGIAPQVEINGDGSAVREFTHVADIANAYLLALTASRPGEHLICNVGTGQGVTVRKVLETVEAVTGQRLSVVMRPAANEPPALLADTALIHKRLGWQPQHSSLDEIVSDAWRAYRGKTPGMDVT
jgi:UDP-glucose 4-epimerase